MERLGDLRSKADDQESCYATAIYSINTPLWRGFQYDDFPGTGDRTSVNLYDATHGVKIQIANGWPTAGGPPITQAEVNLIVQSLRVKPTARVPGAAAHAN